MLGMNKIPVIQSSEVGVFDTTRVKDVRAVRVGNSICVTMEVDETPQVYTADPQMLEYLANNIRRGSRYDQHYQSRTRHLRACSCL